MKTRTLIFLAFATFMLLVGTFQIVIAEQKIVSSNADAGFEQLYASSDPTNTATRTVTSTRAITPTATTIHRLTPTPTRTAATVPSASRTPTPTATRASQVPPIVTLPRPVSPKPTGQATTSATALAPTRALRVTPTATPTPTRTPTPGPVLSPTRTPQPWLLPNDVRTGKWPSQLAGPTGVQPNRYGPQRMTKQEGIPKHAYSPFDERVNREYPCPPGGCEIQPGRIVVKLAPSSNVRAPDAKGAWTANAAVNKALSDQGVIRLEPIFPKARAPRAGEFVVTPQGERMPKPDLTLWHRAVLQNDKSDVYKTVEALRKTAGILWAEPDSLRKPIGNPSDLLGGMPVTVSPLDLPGPSTDPLYSQQWHLNAANIPQAWAYLESQGLPPGGNRNIIVAVIDTGVDYNHPDLAANMWTNSREIAGNGIDDDGNGFVDDVHGADVITNSGNPMDDHGHGTHVAGIIAAQANNGIGGVGVAYNTQIMAIKAAQYSGVLASSDIAEAIYYAVAQGADVINMSFGGYARSQVEEDALAVAFGQAVLVAAAGNDSEVNLPCPFGRDMYPAAYNWVLGVMASTSSGGRANFSNYDCIVHDSHEYELMAPGVDVWSTLPLGQYAAWDGTSMSAPVVSGIAALARTKWSNKDVYSSRFIMGQIAANAAGGAGGVANAYAALTVAPKPELSYLEHWLFDTTAQSATNDNDGIVDAGETIDLAIVIRNHWGKADPVTVTLDAWAEGAYQPDPYVTIITGTVSYGAIGSFNQDDNGLIYDSQGVITGVRNPFRFSVDPNTPNDHVIPFRLTMTARNGLDPTDTTVYTFRSRFYLIVQRGRELPRIISEDMVLTKDYYWIMPRPTLIEAGVTVTIGEGTQLQFDAPDPQNPYQKPPEYPYLQVEGALVVQGTYAESVEIFPWELRPVEDCCWGHVNISEMSSGRVELRYSRIINPWVTASHLIDHAYLLQDVDGVMSVVRSGQFQYSIFRNLGRWGMGWVVSDPVSTSLFNRSRAYLSTGNQPVVYNVFLRNRDALSNVGYTGPSDTFEAEGRAANQFRYNAILNKWWDASASEWGRSIGGPGRDSLRFITDNFWATSSTTLIEVAIYDCNDNFNYGCVHYSPILTTPVTTTYPFVVDVLLSTAGYSNVSALNGPTPIVGAEVVTFTVTFNRDMDTSVQPSVSFGPDVPETDYTIHPVQGGWVDPRTWVGTFHVTPVTGDGYQLMRIAGPARAADDPWLVIGDDVERFRFEVITSGTEAMNLQATGGEGYVDLQWTQNDFDLLAGYNLYRSTSQSGTYTRINGSIIPSNVKSFRDTNVQPGQPYYYKFTVVKSDMSESSPSNIATATPIDTIPPVISHTPVTTAPPGLALSLYADVTDNVAVQSVTLFFRSIGGTTYTNRTMVRTTGNRYSATIEGSLVNSPGLEYYIEATDGISTVRNGRPEYPNQITVVDRPVVTAISPNRGPASGGTMVTIAGSNFKSGATVTLGGAAASNVTFVSSTQITATTPAHFPAVVDVVVTNPDAQSGTLLRGFTFEADTASLSLPNTGGEQHAIVQVPINAADIQGLAAADLTVTFNSSVLSARTGRTGTLTPGWSVVANTGTAGQVRLSMASPGGTVSGSGSLALIEFEVVGSPGVTTTLHIASISLNDGAIPAQTADGSFAVNLAYRVSGTVRTWNGSAGVPGALLTLDGDRLYTAQTSASGTYTVTGVMSGTYTLTPSKSDGVNGISAYDASLVLQHSAGLINLTGYAATAADVNKNTLITALDAFYILQKAVDLITLPFEGAGVVWDFDPHSRSYPSLSADQSGQDFTAILLGDVSGNWSAVGSAQRKPVTAKTSVLIRVQGGTVTSSGEVTTTLWLDPAGAQVYSLDLTLSYDAAQATALSATLDSALDEWLLSSNLTQPGQIRLALAGASPIPQAGIIVNLHFRVSDPRRITMLQPTRGDVNEGIIPVQLVGGPINGNTLYLPMISR
jgi:subtilisin family serine protease